MALTQSEYYFVQFKRQKIFYHINQKLYVYKIYGNLNILSASCIIWYFALIQKGKDPWNYFPPVSHPYI